MDKLLPLLCIFFFAFTALHADQGVFWTGDASSVTLAKEIMSGMSEEEIVAQILLVGWESAEISDAAREWVQRRGLGGIKIFGWNGGDVETLSEAITIIQKDAAAHKNRIPLFTATDQEGGWVRHVKDTTSITPGNLAIGASRLPYDAYMSGLYIAKEMHAIGINVNFAPTVDVYINPEADVIGPRSFSSDPVQVSLMATGFFHGMQEGNIISVAKHYPGHGNADADSHGTLPKIFDSFDTLWNRDLLPYRVLIKEGIDAILTAHLNYPSITENGVPASFSAFFIEEILRERLQFEGLIITDDLYMQGALSYGREMGWSFARLCLEAVLRGNDMIMLSRTPHINGEIWNTLLEAYRNNPLARSRITRSVERILTIKLRYLRPEHKANLFPSETPVNIDKTEEGNFLLNLAARSVTVVRGKEHIPVAPAENSSILLAGGDPDFLRIGKNHYRNADIYRFSSESTFYSPNQEDLRNLARVAGRYDYVFFCLSNPATLQILKTLASVNTNLTVLSILTPIYLQEVPWVQTAIAVYGWGVESFEAGFAVLQGEYQAEGKLPISVQ